MKPTKIKDETERFERAEKARDKEHYLLRLYITGTTPKSVRALTQIKRICETELKGRCTLEVIDIYQQPKLAEGDQIVAVPTLLKKIPAPLRRFIGDFSDTENILLGLDLKSK